MAWCLIALNASRLVAVQVNLTSPTFIDRFGLSSTGNFVAPVGLADNFSGCCLMPSSGELLVILNRSQFVPDCAIVVYSQAGAYRRTIQLPDFDDTEGICLVDATSNLFAIVEEGLNDITLVTITTNTTSIAKASGRTLPMGLAYLGNTGVEGITYHAASNVFYVAKEKFPMAMYRVREVGTNVVTEVLFDAVAAFSGLVTDLSDVFYDAGSGHLLVLSDEGRRIMECDLQGNVLASLGVNLTQPEGLCLTEDRSQVITVGEKIQYARFNLSLRVESGPEGRTLAFPLRLSATATNAVTVDFAVASATAVAGSDFAPGAGTVTFAAGELTNSFSIDVLADLDLEGPEEIQISLTNAVGVTLGGDSGVTHTIIDDGRLEWTLSPIPKIVGKPFLATITAKDTNGVVLTAFTNAVALQATNASGSVAIAPAQTTGFSNGVWTGGITANALATNVQLRANDGRGHLAISVPFNVVDKPLLYVTVPGAVSETAGLLADAGRLAVDEPAASNITIALTSSAPSRIAVTNSVLLPAGATNVNFDLQILDNGLLEGVQLVVLSTMADGYAGTSNTVVVLDDEFAQLYVHVPTGVVEGAGILLNQGMVSMSAVPDAPITVQLQSDDSATVQVPATVVIPAAQTNVQFNLTIPDNTRIDGTRLVSIGASVSNWGAGGASLLVFDNEGTNLALRLPTQVVESAGLLLNTGSVSISGTLTNALVVTLASLDPSELSVPPNVTIPAGQTNADFNVGVVDDGVRDGVQVAMVRATAAGFNEADGMVQVLDNEAEVRGVKWVDLNTNGIREAGEPGLEGWQIYVDLNANNQYEAPEPFALTDATGSYAILTTAGSRLVSEEARPNWRQTYPVGLPGAGYSNAITQLSNCYSPNILSYTFTNTPPTAANGILNVYAIADLNLPSESLSLSAEGSSLGNLFATGGADFTPVATNVAIAAALLGPLAADGNILFTVTPSSTVQNRGPTTLRLTLTYPTSSGSHALELGYSAIVTNLNFGNAPTSLPLTVSLPAVATEGAGTVTGIVSTSMPVFTNLSVNLVSSDSSELSVTTPLIIAMGQTQALFDVTIVDDGILDGSRTAFIVASATYYATTSNAIQVLDNESAALAVSLPPMAREGDGILTNRGVVSVSAAPDENVNVTLTSIDTTELTVPAQVTILAAATSVTFNVTIVNDTAVDGTQAATVTARVVNWTDGVGGMQILDNEPTNLTVSLPSPLSEGESGTGSVQIHAALTNTLLIALASDDDTRLTVPAGVAIPAGLLSATFSLSAVDDNLTNGAQLVAVHATAAGFVEGIQSLSVTDNDLHHFIWNPIGGPHPAGYPFALSFEARTIDEGPVQPSLVMDVAFQASNSNGVTVVSPLRSGAFIAGQWAGLITIHQAGTGIRITADDGFGHTGQSGPFDVVVPRTFYVSPGGLHQPPFTNWIMAATNIQAAVDEAAAGDRVIVTNGVYNSGMRVTPGGSLMNRLVVTNSVRIESVNGADVTSIYGAGPIGAGAVRAVYMTDGTLSGFTVTNGHTRNASTNLADCSGGGVYAAGGAVIECRVIGNAADGLGGGVARAVVSDSVLEANWAGEAGGGAADCTLHDSRLVNNASDESGAGATASQLYACEVAGNLAQGEGGGVMNSACYRCRLSANIADDGGGAHGGILVNSLVHANRAVGGFGGGSMFAKIHASTLVHNAADSSGGGSAYSDLQGCIVYYNAAPGGANFLLGNFRDSCTTPQPVGSGNILSPPLFVNTNAADYRLTSLSPCLDAGASVAAPVDRDLNGYPRRVFGAVDLGCHEYVHAPEDYDGDGLRNDDELIAGTSASDPASTLALDATFQGVSQWLLYWGIVSGREYTVQSATNLVTGPWTNASVSAYTNMFVVSPALDPASNKFYRVEVAAPIPASP